jgi:hypothetical protein
LTFAIIPSVAIGLKHFSISGDFIGPLTMPHLAVNTPCRGAFVGVCLLPGSVLKIAFGNFKLAFCKF